MRRMLILIILGAFIIPLVWADAQEMQKSPMKKLTAKELEEIGGSYALNFPQQEGYWLAVGFTVLVGAATLLAWTRL